MSCKHLKQMLELSKTARDIGYIQRSKIENAKAAGLSSEEESTFEDADFPGPLILPNDAIDFDLEYPPQSFYEWRQVVDSADCPSQRTKIYVAAPPGYTREGYSLRSALWPKSPVYPPPQTLEVRKYLAAFYHGLEVVELPKDTLTFDKWTEGRKKTFSETFVGLNTPKESIRIRKRAQPSGAFGVQLNLNDLLDAAIAVLPDDALALIILVDHDIYEDEDDDFACGRAFGGSHVCVVSSYRYSPSGEGKSIDREHIWPASHCAKFVNNYEDLFIEKPKRKRKRSTSSDASPKKPSMPLSKAIEAHKLLDWSKRSTIQSQWLARLCRTASHELGHCLGIDHCMYYACMMQGTASIAEDLRQPPYLCPVDEAKVRAIIAERGDAVKGSTWRREEALLEFTKEFADGGGFAAFQAWLEERLRPK